MCPLNPVDEVNIIPSNKCLLGLKSQAALNYVSNQASITAPVHVSLRTPHRDTADADAVSDAILPTLLIHHWAFPLEPVH